jgi:hypothetical protein
MNTLASLALLTTAIPFAPADEPAYRKWREFKLRGYPARAEDLIVEVGDPRALTRAEHEAMLSRCCKANMAIYAGKVREADKDIPRLLGRQFGLRRLDPNWLADDDGITQLQAQTSGTGAKHSYIPYTDRPIKWHTDGYYNPPARRIWAMLLHCVSRAGSGGESALMDHEIAYLLLREANPDFIHALMAPDAMTIPARADEGRIARPAETGPVFHVDPTTARLHMRYTARTRSVQWKQDALTLAACRCLEGLLQADSPYIFRTTLEPGMGIVCNNVLHARSGFADDATHRRLLYRARYYDRIDEGAAHRTEPTTSQPQQ